MAFLLRRATLHAPNWSGGTTRPFGTGNFPGGRSKSGFICLTFLSCIACRAEWTTKNNKKKTTIKNQMQAVVGGLKTVDSKHHRHFDACTSSLRTPIKVRCKPGIRVKPSGKCSAAGKLRPDAASWPMERTNAPLFSRCGPLGFAWPAIASSLLLRVAPLATFEAFFLPFGISLRKGVAAKSRQVLRKLICGKTPFLLLGAAAAGSANPKRTKQPNNQKKQKNKKKREKRKR